MRLAIRPALLALALLALLLPAAASAQSRTGLGIYAGTGSNSAKQKTGSTSFSYTDDGGTLLGLDVQFKMGAASSLGVYFEDTSSSAVSCSGCKSGTTVGRTNYGLELRYWPSAFFAALRAGAVSQKFEFKGGGSSKTGDGTSAGVAAGLEAASGLFIKLVYDMQSITTPNTVGANTTEDDSTTKLVVGYRF